MRTPTLSRLFPLLLLKFLVAASAVESTPATGAPDVAATPADTATVPPDGAPQASPEITDTTVVAKLDKSRDGIRPNLGATVYTISQDRVDVTAKGADTTVNQLLLRAPGVAQDGASAGGLHVRGEHSNLQYRINGVLIPDGITGFGSELDPRFLKSMSLITGTLPAQYGFRTAGVVDIVTKTGAGNPGGSLDVFGGSRETIRVNAAYAGTEGDLDYFVNSGYTHSATGIENTTPDADAIHDRTNQYRTFTNLSYVLDPTSRINFIGGVSIADFQLPNTRGVPAGTAPGGSQWVPGTFDSAALNQRQTEATYFGALSYQKMGDSIDYQISALGRHSDVHFKPDTAGDLYFNGVASDVDRGLDSGGLQLDASADIGANHKLRFGGSAIGSFVDTNATNTVFNLDGAGNPVGAPVAIADDNSLKGLFAGAYVQDEWRLMKGLTVNYGARFDVFTSDFDTETQLSPRLNIVWEATKSTTFHAGYARYFTPPPLETIKDSSIAKYAGTSNEAPQTANDPVKAERSHYFDVGVTQQIAKGLKVGLDGYYKIAKNQLDDGLFGQSMIPATFNYAKGEIYGVEIPVTYDNGGFSFYSNIAYSVARGEDWNSSQYLFDPADSAYVKDHWVFLDHDQRFSGSTGVSYSLPTGAGMNTRFFVDLIYGTGLRTDSASGVPNGDSVPAYYSLNIGVEHTVALTAKNRLRARLDLVNVTDNRYVIRDGSGIGVNAAQYGEPFGVFGSIGITF